MKFSEVPELMRRVSIPAAYRQFKGPKEDIPDPPYMVYYEGYSRNFGADNITYAENLPTTIELYTASCRDFALERQIKDLLTEAKVYFNTSHTYIEEEDVYIVYFTFSTFE